VLAACVVNDPATELALGFKFSPFTVRTLVFAGTSMLAFITRPWIVPRDPYGSRRTIAANAGSLR
jgi:glutathione-regulated potassium-efflux system ancillary protein KefC